MMHRCTANLRAGLPSAMSHRVTGPNWLATVLADSPIAGWRLGESANPLADVVGGAYPATATDDYTLGVAGGISDDTAIAFGGGGGYASTTLGGSVSLRAWECLFQSNVPSTTSTLMGLSQAGTFSGINGAGGLRLDTDGSFVFILRTVTNPPIKFANTWAARSANVSAIYADGDWHHVVAQFNIATGAIEIWLDAQQLSLTINDAPNPVSIVYHPFNIGRSAATSSVLAFGCSIDEVFVYDYFLTPSRIAAHVAAIG